MNRLIMDLNEVDSHRFKVLLNRLSLYIDSIGLDNLSTITITYEDVALLNKINQKISNRNKISLIEINDRLDSIL